MPTVTLATARALGLCGVLGAGGDLVDNGGVLFGVGDGGVLGVATISDVAGVVYGAGMTGVIGFLGGILDEPTIETVDIYAVGMIGFLSSVVGFADPIEVPTFYLDSQAHLGGGLPSGLIGGSDEHSGS